MLLCSYGWKNIYLRLLSLYINILYTVYITKTKLTGLEILLIFA